MYFKEIRLKGFRNYEDEIVTFHPKVNIITGKNAQGKTNLLESISIMSMGKSFRTGRDCEMIGFRKDFFRVESFFVKDGIERNIQIETDKVGKKIKIDGILKERNADLLEIVYVVAFSPEDLKIVKEDPEKRRRFIDRELCQIRPLYYRNLGRYKKALLQRNNLLKKGDLKSCDLAPWDELLAEYGSRLIEERKGFLVKLNKISKDLHYKITDGKEDLDLVYESTLSLEGTREEQKNAFLQALEKGRERDLFRGNTGEGPHRDDIKLSIDGVDVRHFGSQGQQRTAALSLKLAELGIIKEETGEDAVLLLDDVLSELDAERQKFLIQNLSENQLFITTADLSKSLLAQLPEHKLFLVKKGKVKELSSEEERG